MKDQDDHAGISPTMSTSRPDGVVLLIPLPALIDRLPGRHLVYGEAIERLDAAGRARISALVIDGPSPVTAEVMDRYPNLALITSIGAGHEGVDKAAAEARGIRISTGVGVNAGDVADHAVTLFLAAARQLRQNDQRVREGRWVRREIHPVPSISALKVGIVGLGFIGKAVAARLAPFGCQIAWSGPRPKPDVDLPYHADLVQLARWADALILCAHLDASSARMVDAQVLEALGPQGIVVNIGRGGLIDEDALIAALREGRLGGAALDVFETEPTPPERWAGVDSAILTPHVGGVTHGALKAVFDRVAQSVIDHLDGA